MEYGGLYCLHFVSCLSKHHTMQLFALELINRETVTHVSSFQISVSPYSALLESLINPLQDKIEDWKKTANQLDKDHAKGAYTSQINHISLKHCL